MPVIECKTKAEYDSQLENAGGRLIVVDFTATWCGPCQMIKPKFEAFSNEYSDVIFLKVDVDENDETSQACGITCMPTFHFIKNKSTVHKVEGANEEELKAKILELKFFEDTELYLVPEVSVKIPVIECATKADYDAQLADGADKLIVVDFTATWCGPCQSIKPKFLKLSEEYTDVIFLKVDVDENAETAAACKITCTPTFHLMRNKEILRQFSGASVEELKSRILELK